MPEYSGEQAQLERWMADLGEANYHNLQQKAAKYGYESTAGAGGWLFRQAVAPLADRIAEWIEAEGQRKAARKLAAYPDIKELGPKVGAILTCRCVLDQISQRREWHQIVRTLGSQVQEEFRWRLFADAHLRHFERLKKKLAQTPKVKKLQYMRKAMKNHGLEFEEWGPHRRAHVGQALLLLFVEATGLVEVKVRYEHKQRAAGRGQRARAIKELIPTDECMKWLKESHERHAASRPVLLPMVDTPVDWEDFDGGGYATDFIVRRPLVKAHRPKYRRAYREEGVPPNVLEAVNKVQRTSWQVNPDVQALLEHCWDTGIEVGGLVLAQDQEIPPKVGDPETSPDVFKRWKAAAHMVHRRNATNRALKLMTARTLWCATTFLDHKKFYYPHQLDFRGRMYPRPFGLQPQGDSIARGLLRFAEAKPIDTPEALRWFRIHGANCWGEDKCSFDRREHWVERHHDEIRMVYQDPMDSLWWEGADKPWEFLAWCLEYGAYLENPKGFESRLPLHMDGSNNGLQLYALLLRDEEAAVATNVLRSDSPQDIYQCVADLVKEDLVNHRDHQYGAMWWDYFRTRELSRKICKRPVMTLPYGVTKWSVASHIQEWFEDEHDVADPSTPMYTCYRQACEYLGKMVWAATEKVTGRALGCMDWLRDMARTLGEHDLPVQWTAPSGFRVYQDYTKYNSTKVRTIMGDSAHFTRIRVPNDELNVPAATRGFPPNFVHSLDASILTATVLRANISHIAVVHDSFGTHAADAEALARAIRESAAEIFSENLLESVRSELQTRLPEGIELPEVPELGSLDPRAVLDSPYFFA